LETDTSSFFAAYSRGDWDPTSVPPIPPELSSIIGETSNAADILLQLEKRESPPELEKSVEDAYRTYLVDARSQASPIDPDSFKSSTATSDVVDDLSGGTFSDAIQEPLLSPYNEEEPSTLDVARVRTVKEAIDIANFEYLSSSESTQSPIACATPQAPEFLLAAASRFAAAGLYRVKCLPGP